MLLQALAMAHRLRGWTLLRQSCDGDVPCVRLMRASASSSTAQRLTSVPHTLALDMQMRWSASMHSREILNSASAGNPRVASRLPSCGCAGQAEGIVGTDEKS